MVKINVDVIDAIVEKWDGQDYSEMFSKGGFSVGVAESTSLDDILTVINTMFEVSKADVFIDDVDESQLQFSVLEDANGIQDDNGEYLVTYIIGVTKTEDINIVY